MLRRHVSETQSHAHYCFEDSRRTRIGLYYYIAPRVVPRRVPVGRDGSGRATVVQESYSEPAAPACCRDSRKLDPRGAVYYTIFLSPFNRNSVLLRRVKFNCGVRFARAKVAGMWRIKSESCNIVQD